MATTTGASAPPTPRTAPAVARSTPTDARPTTPPGRAAIRPRRRRRTIGLTVLPLIGYFALFFVVPFGVIFWYSLGEKPSLFEQHSNAHLSLDRYVESMSPAFTGTFLKTVQISVVGTVLCLLIAYPMAYWMAFKLSARSRALAIALVLVPYWTNFLVRTLGWKIALSPDGFLSNALQAIHLLPGPLEILNTTGAVQLGVVYNYLPLMILPLYVSLDSMDRRLLEANADLGGTPWTGFWKVTVPLSKGGITSGLLLVFVPLMGDYITPAVLGGAKGSMVGQMVASQFQSAQNWALGSAMAIVLILAILACVGVAMVLARAVGWAFRRTRGLRLAAVAGEGEAS